MCAYPHLQMSAAQLADLTIALCGGVGCHREEVEKSVQFPDVLDLHRLNRLRRQRNVETIILGPAMIRQWVQVPVRNALRRRCPPAAEDHYLPLRHGGCLLCPEGDNARFAVPL